MAAPHPSTDQPPRQTVRPLVFGALMLAMLLGAIEATIVSTAMPDIAKDLGSFSSYSWVFSAYLLTQGVMTPIFGKLSDIFGRKPIFIFGAVVFVLGSALCGFAGSMGLLILFRCVQGLGAGALLPTTVTLAGDLYTLEERGRVQGYIASVWGIASIIGPLAGALIVQTLGWQWVFWINFPFGLLAIFLVGRFLHEQVEHRTHKVDVLGAVLLMLGLSTLMAALAGEAQLGPTLALAAAVLAIALLSAFVWQERRAADPIIHFELYRNPIIKIGNLTILCAGMAMIGLITLLPTYTQIVLGRSAAVAGFTLTMMSIGWPIASVTAGRLLPRLGVSKIAKSGGVFATIGAIVVALFSLSGPLACGIGSFLVGVGLGLLNTSILLAIQSSVDWRQRGAATASQMLMRTLGNAFGAAALSGVLAFSFKGSGFTLDSVRELVGAGQTALRASSVRQVLEHGVHSVFWVVAGISLLVLVMAWRVPNLQPAPVGKALTNEDLEAAVESGIEPAP